ncbi:NlpC/P60 family protein [Ureibacillus sp. NPDC094379]
MVHKKKFMVLCASLLASSIIVAPVADAATYVVKKGDTLTKIAKSNKTTVAQLKTNNKLKNDNIVVGQKLVVTTSTTTSTTNNNTKKPATTPTQTTTKTPAKTEATASNSHKVVKGDTLSKISSLYAVKIADIKKWNNLANDTIFIGQVLTIDNSIGTKQPLEVVDEPIIDFPAPQIVQAEEIIKEQLDKEKEIQVGPTTKGKATYNIVITIADSLLGIPYVYGGNTTAGFDCSGFVRYVYMSAGLEISRKSSEDYFLNDTTSVETPVPGDVVFFKNTYKSGISHMGIYIGDGQFIHAGSDGVEVSKLEYSYWKDRFVAYKRFNEVK